MNVKICRIEKMAINFGKWKILTHLRPKTIVRYLVFVIFLSQSKCWQQCQKFYFGFVFFISTKISMSVIIEYFFSIITEIELLKKSITKTKNTWIEMSLILFQFRVQVDSYKHFLVSFSLVQVGKMLTSTSHIPRDPPSQRGTKRLYAFKFHESKDVLLRSRIQ